MTIGKFFTFSFLQLVFLAALKTWFFRALGYTEWATDLVLWAAAAMIAAAMVRRLGVLNFLEAIFIAVAWVILDLFFDALVTLPLAQANIFATKALWISYFVLALAVFFFHKKRHLAVRKEMAARHSHGHH